MNQPTTQETIDKLVRDMDNHITNDDCQYRGESGLYPYAERIVVAEALVAVLTQRVRELEDYITELY